MSNATRNVPLVTHRNHATTRNTQFGTGDNVLAVTCRSAQWMLDDAAAHLQAGRVTPAQGRETADVLEELAAMIRARTNAVIDGPSE